jgi:TolA-binding protein
MRLKKISIYFLIASWALMSTGCRWTWLEKIMTLEPKPPPAVTEKYNQAIEKYRSGDYDAAALAFEGIRKRSQNKTMARKALFGLACARLMMANTPETYHGALALWETWLAAAPHNWEKENPILFEPLIKEKLLVSNIPLTRRGAKRVSSKEMVPKWLLFTTNEELENTKQKLIREEGKLQQSQKRISDLEKEISKLKKQIKALETIDQKIQKKKNAIPSAD